MLLAQLMAARDWVRKQENLLTLMNTPGQLLLPFSSWIRDQGSGIAPQILGRSDSLKFSLPSYLHHPAAGCCQYTSEMPAAKLGVSQILILLLFYYYSVSRRMISLPFFIELHSLHLFPCATVSLLSVSSFQRRNTWTIALPMPDSRVSGCASISINTKVAHKRAIIDSYCVLRDDRLLSNCN